MKTKTVFVCLCILFALACGKTQDTSDQQDHLDCTATEEHILFQSDYENYAWTYTHRGWYINCKGECKSYELTRDSNWNTTDDFYISTQNLLQNYNQAKEQFHQVDPDVLQEMYLLAIAADNGTLENVLPNMADAGIQQYSSYLYDEENNLYKKVLLHQEGDMNVINHHPNIITLKEWLIQIQKTYLERI